MLVALHTAFMGMHVKEGKNQERERGKHKDIEGFNMSFICN